MDPKLLNNRSSDEDFRVESSLQLQGQLQLQLQLYNWNYNWNFCRIQAGRIQSSQAVTNTNTHQNSLHIFPPSFAQGYLLI